MGCCGGSGGTRIFEVEVGSGIGQGFSVSRAEKLVFETRAELKVRLR